MQQHCQQTSFSQLKQSKEEKEPPSKCLRRLAFCVWPSSEYHYITAFLALLDFLF